MFTDTSPETTRARTELRRALSLPLVVLYGLGVTVGAGIYVLIGETIEIAGPFAPVSFLAAAIVVAFTALSYAELSTRYPISAGEAAYVEYGIGSKRAAVFIGLLVALSGMVSAAAVGVGAAYYLQELIAIPNSVLIVGIIGLMGLIAVWGILQSVLVAGIITVVEIGGLLLVIGWGFARPDEAQLDLVQMVPPIFGPHWAGIAAASVLAFFAFVGFEDMANVAEEVRDPRRTMPRAIIATLVVATLLYLGTTIAVLVAVPLGTVAGSSAPLALVFDQAPVGLQKVFVLIAVLATVNGVLIQMIMASRVIYGLSSRGHLPDLLSQVWARTQTPVLATALVTVVVMALALSLPISALAAHTSQIVLFVFVSVNLALLRLKLKGPVRSDVYSVPFGIPVVGALTSASLFVVPFLL